jgi:hypothetical protein
LEFFFFFFFFLPLCGASFSRAKYRTNFSFCLLNKDNNNP